MKFKLSTLAIATALTITSPLASAQAGGVPAALEGAQAAMRSLTATVNQLLASVNQLVSAHNVTPAEVTKLATS